MTSGLGLAGEISEAGQFGPPSPGDIRAQVQRIVRSEGFVRSERLKRFLGFIVEETLAGRGHQIKAYTIAVGVCDRDERFDSRLDPIVRIEAGRLRRGLQHYYLTTGSSDPLQIDIPKGGYHPIFSQRGMAAAAPLPTALVPVPATLDVATWRGGMGTIGRAARAAIRRWDRATALRGAVFAAAIVALGSGWYLFDKIDPPDAVAAAPALSSPPAKIALMTGPSVVLLPFENLSNEPGQEYFAQGLTEDLTRYLSQHTELSVHPTRIGFQFEPQQDPRSVGRQVPVGFVVKGSVRRAADKLRVSVQLFDAKSGAGLWAQTYDRTLTLENFVDLQDEIARSLVVQLVGPMGVITDSMLAKLNSLNAPGGFGTYECTMRQNRFMRTWQDSDHLALRDCWERAVSDHPEFAQGWGALAYVYMNEYRYGYGEREAGKATLERALAAARRAVDLDRMDVPAREALSTALYYGKDFTRSFAASEALAEQYPTDPALAARVAARLAFAGVGRWQEGMDRFYAAKARTPNPPGFYYLITALDAYRRGDDREALSEADKIDMAGFIMRSMVYAMIYGQLGMTAQAQEHIADARRLNPAFVDDPRKWFSRLTFDEILFNRMMDGFQKAGLNVQDRP